MKRILAILCVIAVLCGLCVPAMAAGTVTVHAYVPSDWTNVGAYTWEPEDLGSWPGSKMTKAADGWYEITMPGTHTTLIINSDNGQTVDLNIEAGKDIWVVVGTPGGDGKYSGAVHTSKPSDLTVAPAPSVQVGSLGIVGEGIPGLQNWIVEDTAGDMTKVSDGVYSKVIAMTAGSTMKFKFAANHTWDYNFGGAEADMTVATGSAFNMVVGGQDMYYTAANDGNVKFTVTLADGGATLLVEKTDEEASVTPPPSDPGTSEPTGETYTVYAKIPADWKSPGVWCWNDSDQNPADLGAWPGTYYMTQVEDGWWSIEIPVAYKNILINANGGSNQTADIKGLSGNDVWVDALTDPSAPTTHNEKVEIAEPQPTEPSAPATHPTGGLENDPANQTEAKGGKDLTVLLAVVGSVVIIAVAAVIIIIAKGKKKA